MVTPIPQTVALIQTFDGINEVHLPLNHPKTLPHEYAAWFGKKCGYTISHFGTRYLVMRPTSAYVPPLTLFADYAPGGPLYGQLPKPTLKEYQEVHVELRKASRSATLRTLRRLVPCTAIAASWYGFEHSNVTVCVAGAAAFLAFLIVSGYQRKKRNRSTRGTP